MTHWRLHIQFQLIFLKVIFFGRNRTNEPIGWAYQKLFKCHTFRVVGENPEGDFWAVFRYCKRAAVLILKQRSGAISLDSTSVYFHKAKQEKAISEYLELVLKRRIVGVICRDTIQVKMPWVWRFVMMAQLMLMTPFFILIGFFSKRKSSFGLVLLQWVENNLVGQIANTQHVRRLYLFGGYENDQCLTGLFLEVAGVNLTLVPSPNPIKNFYKQVVANEFVFTCPFQRKEWEDIKGQWNVLQTQNWPLPEAKKLIPFLKNGEANPRQISFMSRGVWLRKLRGVHGQKSNLDFLYEENCMEALRDFLLIHQEFRLLILPHPMERMSMEYWEQTQIYYRQFFEGIEVVFPNDPTLPSYQMFDQSFLSIASISSVNIERLFCGYKAVFAPIGAEHEFFSGSSLDQVVARTREDFVQLLERAIELSENDFFAHYCLEEYRYKPD